MHRIYAYSNLSETSNLIFPLDSTGSSHSFRDSNERKKFFAYGHHFQSNFEQYVIINPSVNHSLDYLNNQLVKQEKIDVVHSFQKSFPDSWHNDFVVNWNSTETWALREWASFWLSAYINASHVPREDATLQTQDLFDTEQNILADVIRQLGLTLTASSAKMQADQKKWIELQIFHNSQKKCEEYVHNVLCDTYAKSPCQTILDEAYVQLLLRNSGYEIRCDGLNIFPKNSFKLKEIMYETSYTNR